MILLYVLLTILILFVITDIAHGIRVTMFAILNQETMKVSFTFLYPLLTATVYMENRSPYLSVYLLKLKVFTSKLLKQKKANMKRIWSALKISDIDLSASYGCRDPSATGLISAMFGILFLFVCIRGLNLTPDFMADENYILMDASANIKVGHTILDYLKNNT